MYPSPERPDQPDPPYGGPRPPLSAPWPTSGPLPAGPRPEAPLSAPLAADVLPASASPGPAAPPPMPPSAPRSDGVALADEQRARIRDDVEGLRLRASVAASWLETSGHYAQLINRSGVVPVTARFSVEDLMFLAEARGQMLRFAELSLRIIDLHQPGDAGGLADYPSSSVPRCRSCMWRWPCPTFGIVTEVLDRPAPM
jgi:hypothetical protein